ncbi:MAG: TetR/AcrR family transcriptional regulator [Clostridiaceae bacterium]
MQYLKDEVRTNITKKALQEFKEKGYNGASIRNIAKIANTSVGNIYKYFDGKDDIYETLIGSVHAKVMGCIAQFSQVELDENAEGVFYGLMENIMDLVEGNSDELSVLFNKSEGSEYENCKNTFIDFITDTVTRMMNYKLSLVGKSLQDNFKIYLLSCSLVNSISIILSEKKDSTEIKKQILDMIDIHFGNIIDKLDT